MDVQFCFIDFDPDHIDKHFNLSADIIDNANDKLLVLNFLRCPYISNPNEIDTTICELIKKVNNQIIIINFKDSESLCFSKESLLTKYLEQKGFIIPIFDQFGELVTILGLVDEAIKIMVKSLLYGSCIFNREIEQLDVSSGKRIKKVLEENPGIFQFINGAKKYWECNFTLKQLFNDEIKDTIHKIGAHIVDHLALPAGKHTEQFIQVNLIVKDTRFCRRLARGLYRFLNHEQNPDTIICFSLTALDLARALQTEIALNLNKEIDVIALEDYNYPSWPSNFYEKTSGRKVILLHDVVNTGTLLESMYDFIKENNNVINEILTVVDAKNYNGRLKDKNFHSLCVWKMPNYEPNECPQCNFDTPLKSIHPDTLTIMQELGKKNVPENIEDFLSRYPDVIKFWQMLHKLKALYWHVRLKSREFKNRHYLAYIATDKFFRDKETSDSIVQQIVAHYRRELIGHVKTEDSNFPFDLILCPPNQLSIKIVQIFQDKIQKDFNFEIKKVNVIKRDNYFIEDEIDRQLVRDAKRILIFSDVATRGKAILALRKLLREERKRSEDIFACVLINRQLIDFQKIINKKFNNGNNFYALFKTAIPPFLKNSDDCPICIEKELLNKDASNTTSSLIQEYCSERIKEIEIVDFPGELRSKKNINFDTSVIYKDVELPFFIFRALILDLLNRDFDPAGILNMIIKSDNVNFIIATLDALYMSRIPKHIWSTKLSGLLNLGERLNSYEVKRNVFTKIILLKLLNENNLQYIKSFILEYAQKDVSLPFIAWLLFKAQNQALIKELIYKKNQVSGGYHDNLKKLLEVILPHEIIVHSPCMFALLDKVKKISNSEATVIILGESGTGKEVVANLIHKQSIRKDGPMITVNCTAFQESLVESELFGHEKGSFTSAYRTKPGKFELADKGTIFLDEIGDMDFSAQGKLLRIIENKTFERVGGTKTIKIDVRIIAATNKDLLKLIESGRFREDLYYRLKVVQLEIPPLRDRIEDIEPLANYFLHKFQAENPSITKIDKSVLDIFKKYNWPGNIRELENAVKSGLIMATGNQITVHDIPRGMVKSLHDDMVSSEEFQDLYKGLNWRLIDFIELCKTSHKVEITNREYRERYRITDSTAVSDFKLLMQKNILVCDKRGRSTKYYIRNIDDRAQML